MERSVLLLILLHNKRIAIFNSGCNVISIDEIISQGDTVERKKESHSISIDDTIHTNRIVRNNSQYWLEMLVLLVDVQSHGVLLLRRYKNSDVPVVFLQWNSGERGYSIKRMGRVHTCIPIWHKKHQKRQSHQNSIWSADARDEKYLCLYRNKNTGPRERIAILHRSIHWWAVVLLMNAVGSLITSSIHMFFEYFWWYVHHRHNKWFDWITRESDHVLV